MSSISQRAGALRNNDFEWRTFGILVLAGLLGTLAILPMQLYGQDLGNVPLWLVVIAALVNTGILLVIVVGLGTLLHGRVNLEVYRRSTNILRPYSVATVLGLLSAVLIVVLDVVVFAALTQNAAIGGSLAEPATTPLWTGFLAGFYGGITEELFLRFGVMTLLVWIGWKLTGSHETPSSIVVWSAIVISAVLFGLGHLPATAAVSELTPSVVLRAIVLNGVGGVVFGWLYWRYDLTKAMVSHFAADMVLHVLAPALAQFFA